MSLSLQSRNYGAMLVVYLIWGTTLAAMSIAVDSMTPALLTCVRFCLAGSLLILFCLFRGEALPKGKILAAQMFIGFLLFFAGNSLSAWAVQHISTGLAGVLVATTPFWMVGLSALFPPKEKVEPIVLLALAVGFIGIVILLWPQLVMPRSVSIQFWLGVCSILMTSFFWAAGSLYARTQANKTSILMGLGIQNLFAGLLIVPICAWTHALENSHPTPEALGALAYLIIFGTIAATSCYYHVLQNMSIAVTSTFAYVTPVLTVLFGCLLLQEPLPLTTAIGTGIILSAVYLVQWCNQRKRIRIRPTAVEPLPEMEQHLSQPSNAQTLQAPLSLTQASRKPGSQHPKT